MPVVSPSIVSNDMPVRENRCDSEKRYSCSDASGINEIVRDEILISLGTRY